MNIIKLLVVNFLLLSFAHALSPFSLENIKTVNFMLLDKSELLSESEQDALSNKIIKKLHSLGIKTESEKFTNFLVKLSVKNRQKDKGVILVKLFIVEEALLNRDKKTEAIAIGYQKEDFFYSDALKEEILESVEFLLDDFAEQYKAENSNP